MPLFLLVRNVLACSIVLVSCCSATAAAHTQSLTTDCHSYCNSSSGGSDAVADARPDAPLCIMHAKNESFVCRDANRIACVDSPDEGVVYECVNPVQVTDSGAIKWTIGFSSRDDALQGHVMPNYEADSGMDAATRPLLLNASDLTSLDDLELSSDVTELYVNSLSL